MPGIRSEADSGADARLVVIPDRSHYPFSPMLHGGAQSIHHRNEPRRLTPGPPGTNGSISALHKPVGTERRRGLVVRVGDERNDDAVKCSLIASLRKSQGRPRSGSQERKSSAQGERILPGMCARRKWSRAFRGTRETTR